MPCILKALAARVYCEPVKLEAQRIAWALFAVHLLAQPVYALLPAALEPAGTLLIVASSTLFAFSHLWATRGAVAALTLLALCLVVAGGLEALSVATGVPFGWYAYSDKLGPAVLGVPVLVPLCWQMMAHNAATVARLIAPARFVVPVAALALTAWDVFLDPQMVRAGYWTWARQGEYVGIPLENYAGWLLTSLIVFALYFRLTKPEKLELRGWFEALPVLSFAWTWFGSALVNAVWWGQPVVAAAGFACMAPFALLSLRAVAERLLPAAQRRFA